MSTVPTFVIEERLPQVDLPLIELTHTPRHPHNYGVALRHFETLVRLDAVTDQVYGPHAGGRLVLTQAGPLWRSATRCRNCREAIWQDGTDPGHGIWMHVRQDLDLEHRTPGSMGFLGRCEDPSTRAVPGRPIGPDDVAGAVDAGPREQLQLVDQDGAR